MFEKKIFKDETKELVIMWIENWRRGFFVMTITYEEEMCVFDLNTLDLNTRWDHVW